jgi:serine/threonine protein phosphatase PrpC
VSLSITLGFATVRGQRPLNEDFAGLCMPPATHPERGLIAAVADGVSTGGHGRMAAQTTIATVVGDFHSTPNTWPLSMALARLITAQNAWLASTNRRLAASGSANEETPLALTTLTALVIRGQRYALAHVGDTRCWRKRGPSLELLTQDHVLGALRERHRLTRAIGLDDGVRIDFAGGAVLPGDIFMLSSDGLHGRLESRQLTQLVSADAPQASAEALVRAAGANGDNTTVLIIRVDALDVASLGS